MNMQAPSSAAPYHDLPEPVPTVPLASSSTPVLMRVCDGEGAPPEVELPLSVVFALLRACP